MKVWPIITLGALIYGSTLADPKGVGRESNPHPHRSTLDAEVAADMKDFGVIHRPVTMAFREVFAKLLNEETDWSAPENKATAQAEADADDGQDPGKKLFWSTNHPDVTGVPFTGWGDPDPIVVPNPVVSPACSTCRPELFFTIIEDPTPPKEDENFAVEAQAHAVFGNLLFGALKALDNMIVATGGGGFIITIAPCETIMVNGVCPAPCKGKDDPLCKDTSEIPPILTEPGGPIVADPTPPSFIGGGGGGVVGQASGVPETSTWLMGLIGFGFLSLFRRSVMSTASGLIPRPTKA